MLRGLFHALAVLHLGPGLAFAVLAFGCDASTPLLGALCGGSELRNFAVLTGAAWALLVPVTVLLLRRRPGPGRT